MAILTPESLEKLLRLTKDIKEIIAKEPELDKTLHLSSRLNGVFGEAIGLAELYSKYKDSAYYEWDGKQTKGYDIVVTPKSGKKIRFQIKASTSEEYVFRVIKVPNLDKQTIREERIKRTYDGMKKGIKEAIEAAQTDAWLLIHVKEKPEFFLIEKDKMAEIVFQHYKNAVENRKHPPSFDEYIDENNTYRPHIQKEDGKLLNKYNIINQLNASP